MVLSSRPASIFDVVGSRVGNSSPDSDSSTDDSDNEDVSGGDLVRHYAQDEDNSGDVPDSEAAVVRLRRKPTPLAAKIQSFRLPRGSSKLLHVRM